VNEQVTGVPSRADLIVFAGMQKGTIHLNVHVAEGALADQFDLQTWLHNTVVMEVPQMHVRCT